MTSILALRHTQLLVFLAALASTVDLCSAQGRPPTTRRGPSITDQMVRQLLEQSDQKPFRARQGVEMSIGTGPIAVLMRGEKGELELVRLERPRSTEEAPVKKAKPPRTELPIEVEEGEAAAKNDSEYPGLAPTLMLKLELDGKDFAVQSMGRKQVVLTQGPTFDRKALLEALRSRKRDSMKNVVLDIGRDVSLQHIAAVIEVTRSLGLVNTHFSGSFVFANTLTEADRATLEGATEALGWEKSGKATYRGELLILLDAKTRWEDLGAIIIHCAKNGIWNLALAGHNEKRGRLKLPIPIPVDKGM